MDNWLLARTYVKQRRVGVGTVLAPEHAEIGALLTASAGQNVETMTDDEILSAFKPESVSKQYSKYKKSETTGSESD